MGVRCFSRLQPLKAQVNGSLIFILHEIYSHSKVECNENTDCRGLTSGSILPRRYDFLVSKKNKIFIKWQIPFSDLIPHCR